MAEYRVLVTIDVEAADEEDALGKIYSVMEAGDFNAFDVSDAEVVGEEWTNEEWGGA